MTEPTAHIQVTVEKKTYFNYSFCFQNLPFLEKIEIKEIKADFEQIELAITSEIGLFEPYTFYIDKFSKATPKTIQGFDFKYRLSFLRNLTEKDLDTITLKISATAGILYQDSFTLHILPIDHFGGLRVYPQLLASYVLPNHPLIYTLKTEAVKILEKNQLKAAFEGYQSDSKDRVLQMVSAMYQAVSNLGIVYSAMPTSFEAEGQRIRLIDQVLHTKFGNCIDISLLFASCLEAMDLNPILVITEGHAFVGVWLEDQRFDGMVNFDQAAISKRIASGVKEIGLIESTHLCRASSSYSLSEAVNMAEAHLMNVPNFVLSIDVKSARSHGILPLPFSKEENLILHHEKLENKTSYQSIDTHFDIGSTYQELEPIDTKHLTKQKMWERRLLDLSLRNNLLNIRFSKSMLQLVDLKINQLEDSLSTGKAFTIHPGSNQQILRRYNLYSEPLHPSEPLFKLAQDEFKYSRLLTYYHQDDLEAILTHLYRHAKLAEEENGKSTLYLGIGLLKWFEPKNKNQSHFAPILLIPVELSRRSVNSRFTLRSREEETMINITLLEYLKQEYKLNLNALETLPMDDSGVDMQQVLAIFRKAILSLEGWDILEQIVLGNFSFNKLILWQDISRYSEEIQQNDVVKSLIDGKLNETLGVLEKSRNLENLPSSQLTLLIATDNSQLDAVCQSNDNKSFILHGPPGTGKSQTITNIIADALANNKKVLFVAAKKAALDVVHQRLEKIGLGPFCLELHSNKSKKSDILQQLERTLEIPKYQSYIDFQEEAARIDQRKKELSQYVDLLHQPTAGGWTLYESISYIDTHGVDMKKEWILPSVFKDLNKETWNTWKDWVTLFGGLTRKLPAIAQHPLRLIKLKEQSFSHKIHIEKTIDDYLIAEASVAQVNTQLNLNLPDDWLKNRIALYAFLEKLPHFSVNLSMLAVYFDDDQKTLLKNWIQFQNHKEQITQSVLRQFNSRVFDANISTIEMTWNQARHTWFLPKWLKQRKVKQFLNGYAKNKITAEEQVDLFFLRRHEFDVVSEKLNAQRFQLINGLVSHYVSANNVDMGAIQQDLGQLEAIDVVAKKLYFAHFDVWLQHFLNNPELKASIPSAVAALKNYEAAQQPLSVFLTHIPAPEMLRDMTNHLDHLEDWIRYNHYKDQAEELGLSYLIHLLETAQVDKNKVNQEMESIAHLNHFVQALDQSTILNGFDADMYETQIAQYKNLHDEFTELTKAQLILELSNKVPNLTQEAVQSSEVGILQRAIRSRGRGISIRHLFDRIPTLLPRLKPCMLMSPISVAQYFDMRTDHFDVVIFDEASQLPTAEAISALARAKQVIIVGDPKQMPPTSFFTSNKVDEENMETEDLESILEDTLALSLPSKHLLRHYRSKHESLISFSNANFYDNKLLTFPSHDDLDKKVSFQLIEGFYDKGKTKTNTAEAQAIIQYIETHLKQQPARSIGVVTFSQAQQTLIEDLLQERFAKEPELEKHALQGDEPIFIKNLENVQGDERDFILFSVGYGPDEEGKVSMNFGPLNRDGGWRRLNVAVTRARYEMKVFSTLTSDQIDLNRTKSAGVRDLKAFLSFAERGELDTKDSIDSTPQQLSLVQSIATHLQDHGLRVRTHIGTSQYRVDIGIVHPEHDHRYIMGILVDGENYFNTQTTNDRELLIPEVLRSLGWHLYRIWTLDWLKNKAKIVSGIKDEIQTILDQHPKKETTVAAIPQIDVNNHIIEVQEDRTVSNKKVPYKASQVLPTPHAGSDNIYKLENRSILKRQLQEIIYVESPISQNHLFRKMRKLWHVMRVGVKLNTYLAELVSELHIVETAMSHQLFYWNKEQRATGLDSYRDNTIEKRSIEDIAPEELEVAVLEIIENSLSLTNPDLVRATARTFGFGKVSMQIDDIINKVIHKLQTEDHLKAVEGRIRLAEE